MCSRSYDTLGITLGLKANMWQICLNNLYILNVVLGNDMSSVNQWLEFAEFCCPIVLEHMDGSTAIIIQCLKYKKWRKLQMFTTDRHGNVLKCFLFFDQQFKHQRRSVQFKTQMWNWNTESFSETICRVFYLCHFGWTKSAYKVFFSP